MSVDITQQRLFAPIDGDALGVSQQRLFVPIERNEVSISEQRLFVPIDLLPNTRRRYMGFTP